MMVAVMVLTVVAVLSMTIATLAMRSTRAAGDAQTAGVVKDLANAGLAEGVTFLRQVGVTPAIDGQTPVPDGAGACAAPTVNSAAPQWTRSNAALVDSGTKGEYAVWIEKVVAPTSGVPGSYRVCAQGTSGQGKRTASVNAIYTPAGGSAGPYAVYGKGDVTLQSAAQVITNMSVHSEHCIDRKGNKQTIGGTDLASGKPAAAHAMDWVLDGPGPDACEASRSVHEGGDYVDDEFPYDTDESGGPTGDSRLQVSPWNGSTLEPNSQTVDQFRAKWGVPDMLGTTSVTALEQTARQQGNYYYLTSSSTASVATPNESHAVVFLDFQNHATVNLKDIGFVGPWATSSCLTGKSLILVFRNADVEGNGNRALRATVVIKNGGFTKLNGTFDLIGGLFADNGLDLSGNGTVRLDQCAIDNPPPGGTPQVDVSNYVEYDRS
jgi:Tfp pilus assembly protein PilX